jgi:hypothetical protein
MGLRHLKCALSARQLSGNAKQTVALWSRSKQRWHFLIERAMQFPIVHFCGQTV